MLCWVQSNLKSICSLFLKCVRGYLVDRAKFTVSGLFKVFLAENTVNYVYHHSVAISALSYADEKFGLVCISYFLYCKSVHCWKMILQDISLPQRKILFYKPLIRGNMIFFLILKISKDVDLAFRQIYTIMITTERNKNCMLIFRAAYFLFVTFWPR